MSTPTVMREYQGSTVPAAGSYTVDPDHTNVEFVARHLMISKVRGSFSDVTGNVTIGEDPTDSSIDVRIGAASIQSGASDRDTHLRSGDFLDVETYPTLSYRSTRVERNDGGWRALGELTIRAVTLPVPLDIEFLGAEADPWGNTKIGFTAAAEIDREAFGLTWNVPLESGGVLVGKTVKIEIEVQLAAAR
jgi:polyisoprenoid-binding protein YceI